MNTKYLITACIILGICTVIVLTLYFRNTADNYTNKSRNEVDEEIEKELRKKP